MINLLGTYFGYTIIKRGKPSCRKIDLLVVHTSTKGISSEVLLLFEKCTRVFKILTEALCRIPGKSQICS